MDFLFKNQRLESQWVSRYTKTLESLWVSSTQRLHHEVVQKGLIVKLGLSEWESFYIVLSIYFFGEFCKLCNVSIFFREKRKKSSKSVVNSCNILWWNHLKSRNESPILLILSNDVLERDFTSICREIEITEKGYKGMCGLGWAWSPRSHQSHMWTQLVFNVITWYPSSH